MSDNSTAMKILISGGGIAGLSFALLMDQRGFKNIQVIERVHGYADTGYVLGLLPNGSRILKGIGLYDKYLALGSQTGMINFNINNTAGELLSSFSVEELSKKYGPSIMVKRADLVKLLYKEAQQRGITVRFNTTISEIVRNDENGVAVICKCEDATLEEEEYDILVGADGLRSKTRKFIFGDITPNYFNLTGWGFWVPKTPEIDISCVQEFWGKGKMIGLYPHAEDIVAVFCGTQAPRNFPDPVDQRREKIRSEFKEFGGIIRNIMDTLPEPQSMWHDDFLEIELPGEWYKGRVVLIGDACHAVLPTAGEGASLALESAFVLAEELCKCGHGSYSDMQLGFRLWQKRRAPRIKAIRNEGHKVVKAYTVTNPLVVYARNKIVQFAGNSMAMLFSDAFSDIVETPI
mmetsp:Transcript_8829/g.14185  ORF Transcript_8829/g.14185 Transcript_8829/m.14185 type:complete len:405 (-) Transcript_8829:33-1247(-)|eukprot:CAMPEP_0117012352 /NCGR_PEP_ID=MMETSP0472-20121206/10415_1 /TAXON_ID=693140 ORGANISM="Tiarina fusus, Strain LIS" /NCGR_SAMPLE_ID=MMETSP0472 /ASSEMBLY_ACC=CAM_ASM_000603 /LENGTH=404 /DNA_ID=CAMNT_0004715401 /DNA_START=12 /DNA_END=1229 /DNA_ORIENTATION=+